MTSHPFLSVVVPVWNGADTIEACLRALAVQDYPQDRLEVIVVDNGSTDRTRGLVAGFASVTLLSEPLAGSYRARNRGLKHARGDYVAFTDADCVPDPDWLKTAARAATESPDAGVLGGRIDLFGMSEKAGASENYERLFSFDQEANVASGMCVTANWVSPRALLSGLGGFDEKLKSGGDAECARRIRAAGLSIVYVPEMLVRHPVRTSIGALIRKRRRVVGGRIMAERGVRRPLSWLWTYFLIGGAQIKRALLAPGFAPMDRIGLVPLIVLLWAAASVEIARIAFGGEPRRA